MQGHHTKRRANAAYVTKYIWVTKVHVSRGPSGVVATLKRISPPVDGLRLRADASSGTAFGSSELSAYRIIRPREQPWHSSISRASEPEED